MTPELNRLLDSCTTGWVGTILLQTQACVDKVVPSLMFPRDPRFPVSARYVCLSPTEPIDLSKEETLQWCNACTLVSRTSELGGEDFECGFCGDPRTRERSFIDCLDWVIVSGGNTPLHPDWVRSLRDQCVAAGVPFWFDGWGEFLSFDNNSPCLKWGRQQEDGGVVQFLEGARVDGLDYSEEFVECDPDDAISYVRVGSAASGHLLDGREWREVPKVTSPK